MGFRLAGMLVVISACAAGHHAPSTGAGDAPRYPPRPANCTLQVFHMPRPPLAAWDDLGVAQVTCHLDTAQPECMQRFKAEACRMGADILYDVPKNPLRPREYVFAFRGRAAHTRAPSGANNPSPSTPMRPNPAASPPAAPFISSGARDGGTPVDGAIESTSTDGRLSS